MIDNLSEELEAYRAGWRIRVPAERQEAMERHIAHLRDSGVGTGALQPGDHAPAIILPDQHGKLFDVATLLARGPVVVTFYRGGWCPYCNLELKAYQAVLPRLAAAGASMVAISPEKPGDVAETASKNAATFPVLSDVGQVVGRAFGVTYAFTEELRSVYQGFGLDIPGKNGTPDDWSLPLSATYLIGADGVILWADTRTDYRERTDPREVLEILENRAAA